MNILFVAEACDSKKADEYLQMPFLQFIATCFSIEVTHFRTLVSKIDTNSNNIIILHFNRQNIPLLKKLREIKTRHIILILYFHADFKTIYNCISDNRNILEDIAEFDILATMQYQLSYQLKGLFKKKIFELLPHQ
ncbi:MAG: hypothetical protein JXJ04_01795, partial [Spirochaetales bacterium]|nr:hypothetical protein [Spirochaetales bacterium]